MGCGLRRQSRRAWDHRRGKGLRFDWRDRRQWRDKSVSTPRDRFHILRGAGIIVQCLSHPIHRFVQGLIEVNESVSPDPLLQLLTSDDLARPLREHRQNPEWLLLQPDRHAMLAQLHGVPIQLVHPETDPARHPITPLQLTLPQNREKTGLHSEVPEKRDFR